MSYNRKVNLESSSNNLLQLAENKMGCCNESYAVCKYLADIAIEAITAITYKDKDGNNAVAAVTYTPGDAADAATAIDTALRSVGLFTDEEIPHIQVIHTDGASPTAVISIFSAVELVNIISTSGTTAFTQTCTQTVACKFTTSITPADGMSIILDDAIVSNPDTINGDFGDPGADEDIFVDEIVTTLEAVYTAAVVKSAFATYNASTNKYDVVFWLYGRHSPTIGGDDAIRCECIRDFIA